MGTMTLLVTTNPKKSRSNLKKYLKKKLKKNLKKNLKKDLKKNLKKNLKKKRKIALRPAIPLRMSCNRNGVTVLPQDLMILALTMVKLNQSQNSTLTTTMPAIKFLGYHQQLL